MKCSDKVFNRAANAFVASRVINVTNFQWRCCRKKMKNLKFIERCLIWRILLNYFMLNVSITPSYQNALRKKEYKL
jgi:hypothetical protein